MTTQQGSEDHQRARRFHLPHAHLEAAFGGDWFGTRAEGFARFFGTPTFLIGQTIIVALWIFINVVGWTQFDVYPFILLNLAFSLQAAYAAPLILLAQTRQADRDKANSIADAQHREELHQINEQRQQTAREQTALLVDMLTKNTVLTESVTALPHQNTELTENVKALAERAETASAELREHIAKSGLGGWARVRAIASLETGESFDFAPGLPERGACIRPSKSAACRPRRRWKRRLARAPTWSGWCSSPRARASSPLIAPRNSQRGRAGAPGSSRSASTPMTKHWRRSSPGSRPTFCSCMVAKRLIASRRSSKPSAER